MEQSLWVQVAQMIVLHEWLNFKGNWEKNYLIYSCQQRIEYVRSQASLDCPQSGSFIFQIFNDAFRHMAVD